MATGKLSYSAMHEQPSSTSATSCASTTQPNLHNISTTSAGGSISAAGVGSSSKIWSNKTLPKFSNVFAALVICNSPSPASETDEEFNAQQQQQQQQTQIEKAVLMLFKEKNGRYVLCRVS